MGGDLETGYDWCYCKPYVHITKRLSGTNTCTYQEWVTWTMCDHNFGKTYRRPKPNTICLGSSDLPSMKRSGRKDSGSSYISGFRVIPLKDILKDLSCLQLVAREKYRPYIYHDERAVRNIISKIMVTLSRGMGNPCGEGKWAPITKWRGLGTFLR